MEDDSSPACFICLGSETTSPELGPLGKHCNCPSLVSHKSCLTRWQLQNAGKAEEKHCRFCNAQLSDWRENLQDVPAGAAGSSSRKTPPIMAVVFQGKTIKVPVCQGPEGVAEFKRTVCKLFNLPEGTDFEVTFECKSPVFGDKLHLKGFDCFEAASYCAAVSAAKRASYKAARAAGSQPSTSSSSTSTSRPGQLNPNSRDSSSHASTSGSAARSPSASRSERSAHSSTPRSPSLMRRLLCGTQPRTAVVADEAMAQPSPTALSELVAAAASATEDVSGSPSMSPRPGTSPGSAQTLPADAPPAAHVATTAAAASGHVKESGRPLSLSQLFRRIL